VTQPQKDDRRLQTFTTESCLLMTALFLNFSDQLF